ncbi:MAG TPA: ribosome biogenesis GTP-binding protein YihA/YsxC [Bacteroidia bacterium]|nr:ribosome biogenesis GTP-binding protein YihA/YsxC [Bacteroidia bacterium]
MKISSAKFLVSSSKLSQCPKADKPEYAFIGRSNVGKSSLINMLCGIHNLARISAKPGKTQLINHFIINDSWYLVDLPGYGFAKVSKELRSGFDRMISSYIMGRTNLHYLFVLVDARLEPQQIDLDFINKLGENGVPFCIVFTKSDKLSATKLKKSTDLFLGTLKESWDELPPYFITSSETKKGRDEILSLIAETNRMFEAS